MRRLHLQLYLAILGTLAVFVIAGVIFFRVSSPWRTDAWGIETAGQFAGALLPAIEADTGRRQRALDGLRQHLHTDLALYDTNGNLLAVSGRMPQLSLEQLLQESGWVFARGGPLWIVPLDDGRRLVMRPAHHRPPHGPRMLILLVAIALAFAVGTYPIARRLTGRLARLQAGVEQLGLGNLTARVSVEGRDEVAALARSFNDSASRIEELVASHKLLLANCSHELRTPLARIRLAIERLSRGHDASADEELKRNIAELDTLIDEMLLASRLGAMKNLEHLEEVDLLALAAEEAAHFDREVEGEPVALSGEPTLLRRMIRNLLDNAQRHAGGATRIRVRAEGPADAQMIVEDQGQGIPEPDRERIFEPFYRGAEASTAMRGSGLGLAIVRQIAQAHRGTVSYQALAGGGSRFIVQLPRRYRPAA